MSKSITFEFSEKEIKLLEKILYSIIRKDSFYSDRAEEPIAYDLYKKIIKSCEQQTSNKENSMSKFNVITSFNKLEIPVRDFDWKATLDNYSDDPNCPVGWGETEHDAVRDLMDNIEVRDSEIIESIKR